MNCKKLHLGNDGEKKLWTDKCRSLGQKSGNFRHQKFFCSVFCQNHLLLSLYVILENQQSFFVILRPYKSRKIWKKYFSWKKFWPLGGAKFKFWYSQVLSWVKFTWEKRSRLSKKPLSVQCLRHWKAYVWLILTVNNFTRYNAVWTTLSITRTCLVVSFRRVTSRIFRWIVCSTPFEENTIRSRILIPTKCATSENAGLEVSLSLSTISLE